MDIDSQYQSLENFIYEETIACDSIYGRLKSCPEGNMSIESYWTMWNEATVNQRHSIQMRLLSISKQINFYWGQYEEIEKQTGVPPYITAVIDYRETGFNHGAYLCNGDPYYNSDGSFVKTVHTPIGLGPVTNWLDGAVLCLKHQGLDLVKNWHLAHALYSLEAWNGFGYANMGYETPYLWNGTQFYSKGLFTSDGKYDPQAFDYNLGAVPILKLLKSQGVDLKELDPKDDPLNKTNLYM